MSQKIITANDLRGGLVVFLTPSGGWSIELAHSRIIGTGELDEALAYAKAQSDAQIVVEPYEIDVELAEGIPVPLRLRERIRAAKGPTVAYGEAELAERAANQAS
ncbi:DUF2849 domain-containing protein [Kaistia algarum]|uniref:DUF2849 domain-containing protein n=1 Tax=Kaistia algarum TaxID=2083279 RepID=UPI000CE91A3A|nr:DUF2849 domain-containing protein [Kaistia algarum]MCX5513355.1 DUF2849 domain-containing protein [Kaistia algarum]PPE81196.1 DUF2849 domain-containing protein [Kaistia algarum]